MGIGPTYTPSYMTVLDGLEWKSPPIFGEEVMRGTAACLNMGTSPTYVSARRKAGCDTPDLAARKSFVHPNVGICPTYGLACEGLEGVIITLNLKQLATRK